MIGKRGGLAAGGLNYLLNLVVKIYWRIEVMKRDEVLDEAKELINGPRATDYGDAYDNHSRIATGWNVIISGAMKSHGHVTPAHVALMMDWVKSARLIETIDHEDSWIDKAGYSALGAEHTDRDKSSISDIIDRMRTKNAK
jgi:hypothetical protein